MYILEENRGFGERQFLYVHVYFSLAATVWPGSEVITPMPSACQAWQWQLKSVKTHLMTSDPYWPFFPLPLLNHIQRPPPAHTDDSAYQCLVVNLLPDELVLTEWVARLSCDGVNGAFFHLLLDGTEEGKEWFTCALLERGLEREEEEWSLSAP